MNTKRVKQILEQINTLPIIDVHSHIKWQAPNARNIGDMLSYHFYNELVNSAVPHDRSFPFEDRRELARRLIPNLHWIANTIQYDWLMTMSREYFGIAPSEWRAENWERIFDRSEEVLNASGWREHLLTKYNIQLTATQNHFDENLDGMDTSLFRPTLRIDNIALMRDPSHNGPGLMGDGIAAYLGRPLRTTKDAGELITRCFRYFMEHQMACVSIAYPAELGTVAVSELEAQRLLDSMVDGREWSAVEREAWASYVLSTFCDACRKHRKPFYFMFGVSRDAYKHGVWAGNSLFDAVNSMRKYEYLLNAYPDVSFPMACMSDTNFLELAAAGWVRHNVFPAGLWWFTNNPGDIQRETRRRIDIMPRNKCIGCFSDAYFLEDILPKYNMYRFELAVVLAERMERSQIHPNMEPFTLNDALALAEDLLVNNPRRLFGL